jgi:hypothetical protein
MTLENHDLCPICGQQTLPHIEPGESANAVCCQFKSCMAVVSATGEVLGSMLPEHDGNVAELPADKK